MKCSLSVANAAESRLSFSSHSAAYYACGPACAHCHPWEPLPVQAVQAVAPQQDDRQVRGGRRGGDLHGHLCVPLASQVRRCLHQRLHLHLLHLPVLGRPVLTACRRMCAEVCVLAADPGGSSSCGLIAVV